MTSTEPLVRPRDRKIGGSPAPAAPTTSKSSPAPAVGASKAAVAPAVPDTRAAVSAPFDGRTTRGTGPAFSSRIENDKDGIAQGRGAPANGLSQADRTAAKLVGGAAAAVVGPAPAGPTATSAIPIEGASPELETADPYAAVTAYENAAGKLLQTAQRDDVKIQGDHRFALSAVDQATADRAKLLDPAIARDEKKRKPIWKRYGITVAPGSGAAMDAHVTEAEASLTHAEKTIAIADQAIPLIDGTYEESRTLKTEVKKMTGGRSARHTRARIAAYTETREDASKHIKRQEETTVAALRVKELGGHVRESKLSADQLTVRTNQFAVFRAKALKAGTGGAATTTDKLANIVAGKVLGALTGGIYRPETKSTDGGHSGALDKSHGFIWSRLKAECIVLEQLKTSAAYGTATGFHAGLQTFMLILRELRDFFASVTIWLGVASVFAPPVIPFAALAGLITVGLSALRSVLGVILLSWSTLQRAFMSNWRAKNTVNAQMAQQGSELLSDVAQTFAPTVAASVGNAGLLQGTFQGTTQQLGTKGFSHLASAGATSANLGLAIGQNAVNKTVALGTGAIAPGLVGFGINAAAPDHDRRGVAAHNQASPTGRAIPAAPPRSATDRGPGWLKDSEASFDKSTKEVTNALVKRHAGKMSEFHAKTQKLITDTRSGESAAATAETKSTKIPEMKTDENAGKLTDAKGALGAFASAAQGSADVAQRLADPKALQGDLEAAAGGGR